MGKEFIFLVISNLCSPHVPEFLSLSRSSVSLFISVTEMQHGNLIILIYIWLNCKYQKLYYKHFLWVKQDRNFKVLWLCALDFRKSLFFPCALAKDQKSLRKWLKYKWHNSSTILSTELYNTKSTRGVPI